jgi:uncharacterized protein (TIGR02594 family)
MFERAMDYYGLEEIPGEENNPVIMGWFRDLGHTWVQGDELAWCACFINWLAWSLRLENSGRLDARSLLSIGRPVTIPERGHIAIFWRQSLESVYGHTGLFVKQQGSKIYVLGGNQDNQVNIKPYPADRLLGYRKLEILIG